MAEFFRTGLGQHLAGAAEDDGTLLLKPKQQGYNVLDEAYANFRIVLKYGLGSFDSIKERNADPLVPRSVDASEGPARRFHRRGDLRGRELLQSA